MSLIQTTQGNMNQTYMKIKMVWTYKESPSNHLLHINLSLIHYSLLRKTHWPFGHFTLVGTTLS